MFAVTTGFDARVELSTFSKSFISGSFPVISQIQIFHKNPVAYYSVFCNLINNNNEVFFFRMNRFELIILSFKNNLHPVNLHF